MLLGLSALTVWAARERADDDLLRLGRELAEMVRRQAVVSGNGSIPYGPGEQRFPDGTRFRSVFNPEYQIDAYAIFHRMGEITGERTWEDQAVKAVDWLVENRYDRQTKRFWAMNDRQAIDYPADAPGGQCRWSVRRFWPPEVST